MCFELKCTPVLTVWQQGDRFPSLQSLDVSYTELNTTLADWAAPFPQLLHLNVQGNSLTGGLPSGRSL